MEELELWKEFREAKVPYVSNRSIKEFYRVFGKISKEQFVSLDLQNGWGDFDSKSGIRKFLFLQKYLRCEVERCTIFGGSFNCALPYVSALEGNAYVGGWYQHRLYQRFSRT